MFHAVFLLVAAGKLMLFDAAFHIVVHPGGNHETVLRAAVHCLRVDVILLLVVLHEPAVLLELVEILHGLFVDFGVMLVKPGFEIDFRLDDMIEGFGVALSLFAGLFGIEHVVGTRNYLFHHLLRRADAFERFYFCHGFFTKLRLCIVVFLICNYWRITVCSRSGPTETMQTGAPSFSSTNLMYALNSSGKSSSERHCVRSHFHPGSSS